MKKQYIDMKRNRVRRAKGITRMLLSAAFFILHSSFFILLSSCSDDITDADLANTNYLATRGYTDEQVKSQRLGYAYNAAGNVMDDSSFSTKPIINMTRLREAEKALGPIISTERRHYTAVDIFSGSTTQELGHEETKYTIDNGDDIGGGKYYRKNTTVYHGKWQNCYKAHMFIKHIMASMTIDAGTLHCLKLDDLNNSESVLDEAFRNDLAALVKAGEGGVTEASAKKFSEAYGTHLIISSNLGGMLELQMEINRDSCIDKVYTTLQVTEVILGKKVTNTTPPSKVIEGIPHHTVEYQGQINVKGGEPQDCEKLHRTFDEKKAAAVKIGDGDYYGWANNIRIEPEKYNAAFVSGRFLPLYELFEDVNTRKVLRKVYEVYLKQEAPLPEVNEPGYGIMPVAGNYGPDVRVASSADGDKACIICQEYVPSIRSDKPCVVAYPLIKGTDNAVRPFFYTGLFVGDESHRPGRIIWEGSSSVYIPNDSIFFESDSAEVRELFDPKTHALKNVYFYWNAVHPQPCATKDEAPKAYTTRIFTSQPAAMDEPTTFAKVASTFWSVRPVVLKRDNINQYWQQDTAFTYFVRDRYNKYDGTVLKDTIENKYFFNLIDGGDNMKRVPVIEKDNDGSLQWIDAVSQSVKAIGLNDYLPNVEQSKSITKMLGNRMSIFYSHEYDGRNMLGLDWPTGYWVISRPSQKTMAVTPQQNDGQGMPIVTNDVGQVRIMRLSGSGTDLLLEYPEYVKAFNYSDQMFFKFFPLYITVDKF